MDTFSRPYSFNDIRIFFRESHLAKIYNRWEFFLISQLAEELFHQNWPTLDSSHFLSSQCLILQFFRSLFLPSHLSISCSVFLSNNNKSICVNIPRVILAFAWPLFLLATPSLIFITCPLIENIISAHEINLFKY